MARGEGEKEREKEGKGTTARGQGERKSKKTGRNLVHRTHDESANTHRPGAAYPAGSPTRSRPTDIFIIHRRSHVVTGLKSLRAATSKDVFVEKAPGSSSICHS